MKALGEFVVALVCAALLTIVFTGYDCVNMLCDYLDEKAGAR